MRLLGFKDWKAPVKEAFKRPFCFEKGGSSMGSSALELYGTIVFVATNRLNNRTCVVFRGGDQKLSSSSSRNHDNLQTVELQVNVEGSS